MIKHLLYKYATACEDMGHAHASGDRIAWSGAASREAKTRLAILDAFERASQPAPPASGAQCRECGGGTYSRVNCPACAGSGRGT